MSSWNKRVLRLVLINGFVITLLAIFMPRQLNWNPSFSKSHDFPYGSEAFYANLVDLFDDEDVQIASEPLYNTLGDTSFNASNYIIINKDFYIDSLDLSALFSMVAKGNNAFLAAESFGYNLIDSLGLDVQTKFNDFPSIKELNQASTSLRLENPSLKLDSSYYFKSQWGFDYFELQDSVEANAVVLGLQEDQPNFVKVKYGNGYFFLHTFPFAFTNYYLMREENQNYLSAVFSHLPKDYDIIWDEYYKPMRATVQRSPLSVLLRYQAFRWVYWIGIAGIILFMVFYAKRKQRPIPIIEAPKNESLDFISTMGSLYFNKGSHKDLANKKINVLKDYLSQKYYFKDLSFSEEEAENVAQKTGKNRELVRRVFELVRTYERNTELTDGMLKTLIKNINKFYDRNG